MAAAEREDTAAGDDPARLLMVRQAALAGAQRSLAEAELKAHRLQLIRARVGIALRLVLLTFLLLLAILILLAASDASRSKRIVVDAFEVPDLVAASGATGQALAASVADELGRLGNGSVGGERKLLVVERNYGSAIARLRTLFGGEQRVGGSVIGIDDDTLRLTVRGEEIEPRSFEGRPRDLPVLAVLAAEHVYGASDPAGYLRHLLDTGRAAAAADFAPRALRQAGDERERAALTGLAAEALARAGRGPEAEEQARLAQSLDPANWHAHAALIEAAADDEGALVASRSLRERLSRAGRRAPAEVFTTEYRLAQDWTRLASLHAEADRPSRVALQAEAEAYRHDYQGARRIILGIDPAEPLAGPLADFTAGLRELDLGRADRAVAPLERFNRAAATRPELGRLLRGNRCYLALAYARLGRGQDALRLLNRESGSARCAALRGDVLALGGDWDAAWRSYRAAVALAPSSPVPLERAAAALLARDEASAAIPLFQKAVSLGPRWADPRFGLAEALMQIGRFSEAERQYRAAIPFAPRWGALHLAWGEALWRLDRQREARAAWRAAAAMDLSAPARARLDRLLALEGGSSLEILG